MSIGDRLLDELATKIIASHSFAFKDFKAAKSTLTDAGSGICIVYDRLSLAFYSHNLGLNDYCSLGNRLRILFEGGHTHTEIQDRCDYCSLLCYFEINPEFELYSITKQVRPDFVLTPPSNQSSENKIGVEVTELTTEYEKVCFAISKAYSQTCSTGSAMFKAAEKEHGRKAENYNFSTLNGRGLIGTATPDLDFYKLMYAERIISKFEKYQNELSSYKEFIILCDASRTPLVSEIKDVHDIIHIAKQKKTEMSGVCIVILWSRANSGVVSFERLVL